QVDARGVIGEQHSVRIVQNRVLKDDSGAAGGTNEVVVQIRSRAQVDGQGCRLVGLDDAVIREIEAGVDADLSGAAHRVAGRVGESAQAADAVDAIPRRVAHVDRAGAAENHI